MITTWILILVSTGDILGQYYDVDTCIRHMNDYTARTRCDKATHGRDSR